MTVEGVINPVVSEYVSEGVKKAEEMDAAAILITLNTPGGLLEATRSTIQAMLNTEIPVIVYVSPRGSRATSAGVFITMAADIAAMAPETHLGAAHPVTIGGRGPLSPPQPPEKQKTDKDKKDKSKEEPKAAPKGKTSVMEEKMVSDSAAYIRSLAKEKGRNAEWAEKAVRESVSLTAEEAEKENVIDFVVASEEALFEKLDGRKFTKNEKTSVFKLKGLEVVTFLMDWRQKFFHHLGHPNVAYLLMMIGFYGIIYEFLSPGFGFSAIVGVICLILAFFSLQVLPINLAGLALIIFGILLLITDLITPTYGLLTIGGLISFALGSLMLIDSPPDLSYPRVSLSLILPTVIVTGLMFGFVLKKVLASRKRKPKIGKESLIGQKGEVREKLSPEGVVFLNGELWTATSEETIKKGARVEVVGHEGNKLIVKKETS